MTGKFIIMYKSLFSCGLLILNLGIFAQTSNGRNFDNGKYSVYNSNVENEFFISKSVNETINLKVIKPTNPPPDKKT